MLVALDYTLYWLHLLVTGFNLCGWVFRKTRSIHRWCVSLTLISWLGVGLWVGHIGYCFLTDWHWRIKRQMGETNLPNSFITYLCHQVGFYPDPVHVDMVVGITFAGIVLITIGLWMKERRMKTLPL